MQHDMGGYQKIKQVHQAPPAAPFPVVTFAEIKPRLENNALVKGLLGAGSMSVLYGDSNTGKTFLTLDVTLHITLGWTWYGRRVRQGGAIYIAGEGAHGIENRVAAFRKHHHLDGEDLPFAVIPSAVDLCSANAETERLISTVNDVATRFGSPIAVVVVDTLSRALAGGNENSPEDMGAYVRHVDRIRQSTNAHVLSVHHCGKDAARGARGHSLLRAATDTEIEVTRDEASGISSARISKQRDLPIGSETMAFRLAGVELGMDEDGAPVTYCVVDPTDGPAAHARQKKISPAAKQALAMLHDAMIDNAQAAPISEHVPAGIQGVTKSVWRRFCEKGGIINPEGNPRQQLIRLSVTLKDAGFIGVWDDFVWPSQGVTSRHSDAA